MMASVQTRKRDHESASPIPVVKRVNPHYTGHLLAASIIGLNRSLGKLVFTGYEFGSDNCFRPIVSLSDNKFYGVTFTSAVWKKIFDELPIIGRNFDNGVIWDDNLQNKRIQCDGFAYSLTTLYKNKTCIIYQTDDSHTNASSSSSHVKKPKFCEPNIYLQASTFEKFMNVAGIINMRLKNLQSTLVSVEKCKNLIIESLKSQIPLMEELLGNTAVRSDSGRIILQNIIKKKAVSGDELALVETIRGKIPVEDYSDSTDLIITEILNVFDEEIINVVMKS